MDGGTLDAGHFTFLQFNDFGLEATTLGPAQVHAQQHVAPVLGFSAAGAGLDIQVGVVGIHFAGEHAAEFELLEFFIKVFEIGFDFLDGAFVVLFHRHVEQAFCIGQAVGEVVDGFNDQFKV